MDHKSILKINMNGTPYVEGVSNKPTFNKLETVNPSVRKIISQEDIQKAKLERIAKQGQFAWSKKHTYLGCDPQWHELWELLIPRGSCSCSDDYAKLKEENPPDFSSPEKYFLWGHRIHNLVNMKLEKRLLTIAEAVKLWGRTDITLPTD